MELIQIRIFRGVERERGRWREVYRARPRVYGGIPANALHRGMGFVFFSKAKEVFERRESARASARREIESKGVGGFAFEGDRAAAKVVILPNFKYLLWTCLVCQ
eukprot:669930-Amorphochlora_amoeboformis.AAC.1